MRIDLRLCKTVRSTDCWGDLQSLRNLRQFVTERIDGGKPETNREETAIGLAEISGAAEDEKGREQELRARQEKFPLRDFSQRGNVY